jgi:exodeoxyribonuclease VII large subunit
VSTFFDLPFEEPEPEEKPAPPVAEPPARRIYTVAQLTARIRSLLEREFYEVWVEGELSNCKAAATGHMYFTLKDGQAQVRGVIFRVPLSRLRFKPKDGMRVVARGRITVYDPRGEYQLLCEHLEPEGIGARQLAFEQLKQRLAAEGLFAPQRKRPLPLLPRKIGVVTSLEGAAIRDIIKVLGRRYPNAHIVLRPTRVQGDGAALEIARGLRAIGKVRDVDVVIVGRGGGSIEDLWAFNEEVVARAIAGCPVPTISAVGHETDVTIADFVADLRAPTPSAAAEMVVSRKDDFCSQIDRLSHRLTLTMRARLHRLESQLRMLEARSGYTGAKGRLAMYGRHVSELESAMQHAMRGALAERDRRTRTLRLSLETFDPRRRLEATRTSLVSDQGRLIAAMRRQRHGLEARLGSLAARLDALSPLAVLGRGYAVCWNADRTQIIRDAATVTTGDDVQVALERGTLLCEIKEHL